jgi:hypothetical protein
MRWEEDSIIMVASHSSGQGQETGNEEKMINLLCINMRTKSL